MLNPAICAIFMYQGFTHELKRLCEIKARQSSDEHAEDDEYANICGTLGGGEIECAAWFVDLSQSVCEACEEAFQSSSGPGIWYYEIGEWLGQEVACRASKEHVTQQDVLALAVKLTERWDEMETPPRQLTEGYVMRRLAELDLAVGATVIITPTYCEWQVDDVTIRMSQRAGHIYTLTALPDNGGAPLLHENLIFFRDSPEPDIYSLI